MACEAGMVDNSTADGCPFGAVANCKQISNFLKYMVSEINLDSIKPKADSHAIEGPLGQTRFYPVRRRLDILDS